MGEEAAKWYVIHTYSGYEALVKDTIEKLIENNNLSDTIFNIQIPMEETIEEKNGKKKVVMRKTLPCYVFIKMIYSNEMWFLITNTRGVTGFVGPQGKAVPLDDAEVKKMRLEDKVTVCDLAVGDQVRIVSGSLATFVGEVTDLNTEKQKAQVRVSVFGRDTEVEMDLVMLDKISQ